MTISSIQFKRHGDKKNSGFFEEYLGKLLEERDRTGLTDLIGEIDELLGGVAVCDVVFGGVEVEPLAFGRVIQLGLVIPSGTSRNCR